MYITSIYMPVHKTLTSSPSLCCAVLNRLSAVQLFAAPWIIAHQALLSMGFFRQEYRSGLPWPPSGDLSDPGIKLTSLMSPALADTVFTTSTTWKAQESEGRIEKYLKDEFGNIWQYHMKNEWSGRIKDRSLNAGLSYCLVSSIIIKIEKSGEVSWRKRSYIQYKMLWVCCVYQKYK